MSHSNDEEYCQMLMFLFARRIPVCLFHRTIAWCKTQGSRIFRIVSSPYTVQVFDSPYTEKLAKRLKDSRSPDAYEYANYVRYLESIGSYTTVVQFDLLTIFDEESDVPEALQPATSTAGPPDNAETTKTEE